MSTAELHPAWLVIAASGLALVPAALGTLTSYLKVSIVLGMLRSGLGTQQVPGPLTVMVLSLAVTGFIVEPVAVESVRAFNNLDVSTMAAQAPTAESVSRFAPVLEPWRGFLARHTDERELTVIAGLRASSEPPDSVIRPQDARLTVLIPAFVLTELKEGFVIGFLILVPFLVIDLVVSNVLAGMGMYMVSPILISLPLKLLLFVSADGWLLLTRGLVISYTGAG